jgi:NADPH-dependent glutamate synthase beta subunit-like oxidoreductase
MGCKGFYVAIGAQKSAKLRIPGEELDGVYGGVDFLRAVNLGHETHIGKRCAVIGGGNVAIDAARVSLRCGSDGVTMVCLEPRDKMPASPEEIAEAEGVHEESVRQSIKRGLERMKKTF